MDFVLDVALSAPFALGDVVAVVTLERQAQATVVLREGRFQGRLPARPERIRLTDLAAPAGEAALAVASSTAAGVSAAPGGILLDVHDLFVTGCEIPPDGHLEAQVLWGAHCHSDRLPDAPEGRRFASWEHVICARFVGRTEVTDGRTPPRLRFNGITADFDDATQLPLGTGAKTFGEIVCLAGDFYAHLDEAASAEFEWAWPPFQGIRRWIAGDYRGMTLRGDTEASLVELMDVVRRDRDTNHSAAGEFATRALDAVVHDFPARRYLALSAQNYCHFVCPGPDDVNRNEALRLYRGYHARALAEAQAARTSEIPGDALRHALVTDAFGCHFLTDLFASGHMRVPRRLLSERYGILRGALSMSLAMHNEDNVNGLWCTSRLAQSDRSRLVWRAYGDGMLRDDVAVPHLKMTQEAVRRSAAEVFAAYCGATLPESERAEAILPMPLCGGQAPSDGDVLPDRSTAPVGSQPNPWPLYWFIQDRIVRRTGDSSENIYQTVDNPFESPQGLP
jgi:hypothetical protein